jgi:RNA polymerase sigma factor (sigma-70 family)
MVKRKEPTITITDIATKCDTEVGVALYYKICCRNLVFKYFNRHKIVFASQGIELNDLKQDILLMICQILEDNKPTNAIPSDKMGGYLYNATKRQLNNILSKATTTYKRNVSLNVYHVDAIYEDENDTPKKQSDILSDILSEGKKETLMNITKSICSKKEAITIKKYYFENKNMTEIAKDMEVSKQRVSALMKSAMFKLKTYCMNRIEQSKE